LVPAVRVWALLRVVLQVRPPKAELVFLALLVAGCMSSPATQQASHPSPTPSPPPGVTAESGVEIDGAAIVHDVRYASGDLSVVAYLVIPAKQPTTAGVLFFHWLSSSGGNRTEFKQEAVGLAAHGIASLLVQGDFPWSTKPSGADHDIKAIDAEVAGVEAGVDLLLKQPGVDAHHLAYVGHDYGAMHGAVLLAKDSRFAGAILMAPDAHWVNWFNDYWTFIKTPAQRAEYAKALLPLDPATMLRSVKCKVLLQFARSDEYLTLDREHAVETAVPAKLRETRWYDSDHAFNDAARADRDAWLLALLA
jgi:pimeloyl-ACP methyl ester carboxylesterase